MQRLGLRGFTLIELMIAIVVVALLTTVALPAYLEHLAKSRRAEGRKALLEAAQLQERFYSTRTPTVADPIRYAQSTGNPADFPTLFGLAAGATVFSGEFPATTGHYTLSVDAPTATCPIASCFTLRATPTGRHDPDARCRHLTLDSAGTRGTTGDHTPDALGYCWGK